MKVSEFKKLEREELIERFREVDVRVMAAAYLLRYRTMEATAVLADAARAEGFVPFKAAQALKRWEEGTWALDPAP